MIKALVVDTMPKGNKPKRDDKAVKIERPLAVKAGLIADARRITVAEYLSDLLRSQVEKDWLRVSRQLDQHPEN